MGLGNFFAARLAGQLRGPHGLSGRVVARQLNKVNRRSISAAIDELDPAPGTTVADVGFGGGVGLGLLLDRTDPDGVVHGVDPMADMVRRARRDHGEAVERGSLVLQQATMEHLPFQDRELDGLITCNTIYFMTDLALGFAELARTLRPGGAAVIGIADPDELRSRPFADHGFTVRTVSDVADQLEAAGFEPPTLTPVDIDRGTFLLLRANRLGESGGRSIARS